MIVTASEPRLAPPGAGLPTMELFFARLLFAAARRRSRARTTERFLRERRAVRALLDGVSPERGGERVLIKRPPGLEDSSRYWSVWMTLDHLRIVQESIVTIIAALGRGERLSGGADTATVKPAISVGASVRETYEASCDALLAAVAAISDLHTAQRYRHPWFGPLDAAGWHTLAGVHLGLHRTQIERILADPRAA